MMKQTSPFSRHAFRRRCLSGLALASALHAMPAMAAPFTDNGDGTVTDEYTGLIWDKCAWGQAWSGPVSNTCGPASEAAPVDWADALQASVQANAAQQGAGHRGQTDWRVPNIAELESIVELSLPGMAIDPAVFPNTPVADFWSSSPRILGQHAWLVGFQSGRVGTASMLYQQNRVRLVREGNDFDVLAGPVAGAAVCGTAATQPTLLAPSAELCARGTPSPVVSTAGQHTWYCSFEETLVPSVVQCSAPGADAAAVGGQGSVTLSLTGSGCVVERAELVTPPAGGPLGVSLPYGAVSFSASGCESRQLRVDLSFSGVLRGMRYWKYIHGAWQPVEAELGAQSASFLIDDNGPLDTDPRDGVIADPSGPGLGAAPPPGLSPIPALAHGAALLWAGVLGVIGAWRIRRVGVGGR